MEENKIRFKAYILITVASLFIVSCGAPPENAKETRLLTLINDNLNILNKLKNDDNKLLKYFKEITNKFDGVITFKKGDSINFISKKIEPKPEFFAHTLDGNRFATTKDVYITVNGKETYFSFNNKTWYSNKTDPNLEIEGLRNDYIFESQIRGNEIFITYSMGIMPGRKPIIITKKLERPIVRLKQGLVFSHIDTKKITADLEHIILFIPAGTTLSGMVNVTGNLVSSETQADKSISVKAAQDIFIYLKGRTFTLSFDKMNWNPNIFSFDIRPDVFVSATSDKDIYFDVEAQASFEKNKISMSIIQLLLKLK